MFLCASLQISGEYFTKKPLEGRSSGKREASGSNPTGGKFPFLSQNKKCSKELFHNFQCIKHFEISNI